MAESCGDGVHAAAAAINGRSMPDNSLDVGLITVSDSLCTYASHGFEQLNKYNAERTLKCPCACFSSR
jgi:hypothetical protein